MTDYAAHIEEVATHYWGKPNPRLSNGTELRWGNNGSKSVCLQKGVWTDFESGETGGLVALVKANEPATISGNLADILESKFGIAKNEQAKVCSTKRQTLVRRYDYRDATGSLVYQVERYENPKTFRQRRPDGKGGWIPNIKDVQPVLYNLPELLNRTAEPIYLVEGEKDADALMAEGVLATTNSGGAAKWDDSLTESLRGREVIILPDNDEPGLIRAQRLLKALTGVAASVEAKDPSVFPEKGDVSDFLADNHRVEELHDLPQLLIDDSVYSTPVSGDECFHFLGASDLRNMPPIEWLVGWEEEGFITAQGLSLIYGAPATGKSFLALDMALSIANGVRWQGVPVKQGKVLFVAGEGVAGLGKRLKAWEAHHKIRDTGNFCVLPIAVNFREPSEVDKLIRSIEAADGEWACVVIDTVARSLSGGDENSATDAGVWIAVADRVRQSHGCALIGVHHSGKDTTRGMRGSSAFLGGVDTSLLVTKERDSRFVKLSCEKQKDAELAEDQFFEMVPVAMLRDTSVILRKVDAAVAADKKKSVSLTPQQSLALEALRSLTIDTERQKHPSGDWAEAHRVKVPDEKANRRGDHRNALITKGLVASDRNLVWLVHENR
ncbi:AAA family ATPase [Candidatus Puniceispirillum sp.]|nr:AAA family ATPase [Candidatus Puniceispirillum sp.]